MQLSEAVICWLRYVQRFTPRTQLHYRFVILRFLDYAPEFAENLTLEHIERYIDSIKHSNRTKNAHLTAIRSFTRYLSEHQDIPNPCLKIKMLREDPPKRRYLSPEEVEKILSVCKKDGEKKVIQFLICTGLRVSELQALQPNNVSYDLKSIRFTGKGRKERVVPLNETAKAIISNNGKPTMNFLKSFRKRNSLFALTKRLSCRAAVPQFSPHALRRFFATQLLRKGVKGGIYTVSQLLSHADVRTTQRYIGFTGADLEGSTDCLDD